MPQERDKKRYAKPLPHIDEESRPWWEAAQRHELYIQKCRDCGDLRYPSARALHQLPVLQHGMGPLQRRWQNLYFYRDQPEPGRRLPRSLPYVMAWVRARRGAQDAHEHCRLPPEQVKIGMPVEAVFDDVTPEVTLVKFRPAR